MRGESKLIISTPSNLSTSITCILPELMVSSLLQVDVDLPTLTNHSLGLSGIEKSAILLVRLNKVYCTC